MLTAFADVNVDVRKENTDVRWVGFLPHLFEHKMPLLYFVHYRSCKMTDISNIHCLKLKWYCTTGMGGIREY
jgi:hypothetical protein